MNIEQRKNDFIFLSKAIEAVLTNDFGLAKHTGVLEPTLEELAHRINTTYPYNGWFTPESIKSALEGIVKMLQVNALEEWVNQYPSLQNNSEIKRIGIVMAGNIPLVGFHDFLCVVMSGNKAVCKLSSSDDRLWPIIFQLLFEINEGFKDYIEVVPQLKGIDAVIATGSNNTSRYFEHYFAKYPHIIRKNRNSIAILKGDESEEELKDLAKDVFLYFGLGCRNVAKIYLPKEMDLNRVIGAFYDHKEIINHNKYANNYDYNKTVMLLNEEDLLDNGFLLFKKSPELASSLATLNYEYYDDYNALLSEIETIGDKIQCIVSKDHVPFGNAQSPNLNDYADGVDVMAFLSELNL
jgi:hypothetical protein